ncbi:MAG: TIGR00730 family Rossman fold protein [Phycisphaerae bacterium]
MPARPISRLCVFCGSNRGAQPKFEAAARDLGATLANESIALVYGGGRVGLMGVLADAALESGGDVIGVIPHALDEVELAHDGLTEMHVVDSMHERKALMADLSDGFVALPGGLGTFEEFFEVVTWAQLGIHAKPCGVLNVAGYFDKLVALLDHAVEERFIKPQHRDLIMVEDDHRRLLDRMRSYRPPVTERWVRREQL